MSKQIRPLVAFKKENIEYYNSIVLSLYKEGSEKSKENNFYYSYAIMKLMRVDINEDFFFKNKAIEINRGLITELGRLLIYGWYYQLHDYTIGLCSLVIEKYLEGGKINRERALELIKHIRENILYYNNNNKEAVDLIKYLKSY